MSRMKLRNPFCRHAGRIRKAFFILLALAAMAAVSAAGEENLLKNSSFEALDQSGLPKEWKTDSYVKEEGYTVFSVTEEDFCEGSRAAVIRNIGDNDARFYQKVNVEPESLYRFSGYIRTENVEGGRGANLSIEGLYAFSESVYDTSDGWQYIEWYGETGEGQHSVTLFARLGGYSGESRGKAWFDDLKLEKVNVVPGSGIASRWYQEKNISYYEEDEEPEEAGSASPAWPRLIMLTLLYTLIAILLTQWLRRERRELMEEKKGIRIIFWAGLAAALLFRMAVSSQVLGYMVDVNCFLSWGNTMATYGPAGFYPETNFCDYPPAYTYILGLNSLICRLIPGISDEMRRVVFRFFPSLCDILCCLVLDRFLQRRESGLSVKARVTGLLLLAFHPVLILNSAAWGQMDSALALLILLVAVYAIEGKWEICLPAYMLAVLVKPQALMLGFLGLAAIALVWVREKDARKRIMKGIGWAAAVLAVVVIPFSIRQDPLWIIDQYAGTLASYPYATVNTANFYYLLNGNWSAIGTVSPGWGIILQSDSLRTAGHLGPAWAALGMTAAAAVCGCLFYFRTRKEWRFAWIEPSLSAAVMIWFVYCGLTGASWGTVGTGAMVFAFVIVISLYLRKGDIHFLPYLGGLLFLLLYIFGVKMHERYIFPAFLLLAMAYGIKRDRRILYVLLTISCTAFINEGIVLDNSIRLGSASGHLNQDTYVLAMILSVVNCLTAGYAVWLGFSLAMPQRTERPVSSVSGDIAYQDNSLHWNKKDTILLCGIIGIYSLVSLMTLGSTKAPQTAWTSTEYTESAVLDLGEEQESFTMLYFARVSRYDFTVATSRDGINWEDETWAQMDQGQCWKWKYVTDSTQSESGSRTYGSARHWFQGRYVRITSHQINLALCEVIFRDGDGHILPVAGVTRNGGDPESSLYSPVEYLTDEQDSMEAMPIYFPVAGQAEGEDNPRTAQPSWWNSTYFDEIYHARTAWEFLQGSAPYETSHPPLGKVLMSWSVALFGMTPFGWRFAGALAGILMLALIYLILKQMFKTTGSAAFGTGLLALDCMHLTQTQIATIDSFPVLFILMAYFFMLRFLQTDWRTEGMRRILCDLGLCGLGMGLSIASKWIGIYAGAGLAVLFFWHGYRVFREERKDPSGTAHKFGIICLWCVLFFVIVPILVYLLSYIPYFAHRHFTSLGDYLQAVVASQEGMFNYHSTPGLGMDHPFYSPWYEWPVIGKPMFYSTKQYIFNDDLSFSIFCFGNPVIWWAGIPGMIMAVFCWIRNREKKLSLPDAAGTDGSRNPASLDTALVFILTGFLAQYLPWTLVPRGTYIYHYFASVPFLILGLTAGFEQIRLRAPRAGLRLMVGFTAAALASFILFFPYASGIMAPVSWLDLGKKFLKIWY